MDSDKARLHEVQYSKNVVEKRGYFEQICFVLLITITSLTLVVSFCSWRNSRDMQILVTQKVHGKKTSSPFNPPPYKELAKTARYIAHYMEWSVMSTISKDYDGFPVGSIVSVSDGPVDNSTGVPYIYVSSFDSGTKNFLNNPKASLTFSEAQSDYCTRKNLDPEDPVCGRLTLSGKMVVVPSDEIPFAKEAVFSRHPEMKDWPSSHNFFFAKLTISRVNVLDYFGPSHDVPLEDYFAAKCEKE